MKLTHDVLWVLRVMCVKVKVKEVKVNEVMERVQQAPQKLIQTELSHMTVDCIQLCHSAHQTERTLPFDNGQDDQPW